MTDDAEDVGFNKWNCRCGERFGWYGRISDVPSCPRCGQRPDPGELTDVEDRLAEAREKLLREIDREDHEDNPMSD